MIYLRALHAQAEAAPLLGAEPLVARLQFGWGAAFRQEYIGGTARAIGRPGLLLPLELNAHALPVRNADLERVLGLHFDRTYEDWKTPDKLILRLLLHLFTLRLALYFFRLDLGLDGSFGLHYAPLKLHLGRARTLVLHLMLHVLVLDLGFPIFDFELSLRQRAILKLHLGRALELP